MSLRELEERYTRATDPSVRQKLERMIEKEVERRHGGPNVKGSEQAEVMATMRRWR